jgi:hypothetical protein
VKTTINRSLRSRLRINGPAELRRYRAAPKGSGQCGMVFTQNQEQAVVSICSFPWDLP